MTTYPYRDRAEQAARIWGPALLVTRVAAAVAADLPDRLPWWVTWWEHAQARRDRLRARLRGDAHKQVALPFDRETCQLWVTQTAGRIYRDGGWRPPVQLRMDDSGQWRVRTGAR
jgi:hypothetical protein